jgi:hypothetical protein
MLLAVALVSAGALAYEVLLTRLFSIVQWHHYAYMVISIALLGYGASGAFLALAGEALRARLALRGETPPAGRQWKIAVCGPHPPARIALGDQFEPTWDPKGADFALMLGAFYCARLDAPLLAES